MEILNKEAHDKVLEEHELNSRKKQYFENLKVTMVRKDIDEQKRNVVEQIMQKSNKLETVKE